MNYYSLLICFIPIISLLSGCINNDDLNRYYTINIQIEPEDDEAYFLYIPMLYYENEGLIDIESHLIQDLDTTNIEKVSTEFGEAMNISSDGEVIIRTDEKIVQEHPNLRISLENNEEGYFYERTTSFNLYMNSTKVQKIHIRFSFNVAEQGGNEYSASVLFEGDLTNGWNVLNGSIEVSLN